MADERTEPAGTTGSSGSNDTGTASGAGGAGPEPTPGENLRRGFGLLFEAAKQAATGVRKGFESPEVKGTFRDAVRRIDGAATAAAHEVERFVSRFKPPAPPYVHRDEATPGMPKEWTGAGAPPPGWDAKPKTDGAPSASAPPASSSDEATKK